MVKNMVEYLIDWQKKKKGEALNCVWYKSAQAATGGISAILVRIGGVYQYLFFRLTRSWMSL